MNNVVKIDVALNYTTGIIFPCENDSNKDSSYIIITNRHLSDKLITDSDFSEKLMNCSDLSEESKLRKYFNFTIYDEDNVIIPNDKIMINSYFISESYDMKEDIMIFLISIKGYKLRLCKKISKDIDKECEIITEGYPGTLSNDNVSKCIRLKGLLNENKFILEGMSRYTIEDYHYYDNLTDLKILSGLSGAPVKKYINNVEYIIGMNVSLPYQNKGENPFKLLNFIKIEYLLNYLRKNGVIIYDILTNSDVRIKWIKSNRPTNVDKKMYNKTILVLGSSGSGKSSFIKSFALNNKKIDSSGEGQTTRSKIYYSYSLFQPFNIDVKLLSEPDFTKQRLEDIQFDLLSYIFTQYYELKGDIYKDKLCFLKEIYTDENFESLKTEIIQCIISNSNSDIKIIETYCLVLKKIRELEDEKSNSILRKNLNYNVNDILEILLFKEGLFDIQEFIFLFEKKNINEKRVVCNESKPIKDIYRDYFNGENKSNEEILKPIFDEIVMGEINGEKIKSFYKEIYEKTKKGITEYFKFFKIYDITNTNIIFNEKNISSTYIDNNLSICLKVVNMNGYLASITSIVKEVTIKDSISNEFATLFNDMNINSIKFIDTRGLDHLEKGIDKESLIKKIFNEEKEKYEDEYGVKYEDGIDAVLYLKKLDSGKPTELSDVIPLLYKTSPQISLYTVMTGVDIFYPNSSDKIIKLSEDEKNLPKPVQFLKSKHFENVLKNNLKTSTQRKRVIHNVLIKNIIAFYGDTNRGFSFTDSNKYNIKKLLKSIIMRENMSVEYIKEDYINNIDGNKKNIVSLLELLFEKASIADFGKTNAPATNFDYLIGKNFNKDSYDFGYYGNYQNRLDLCFNNAYIEVFSQGEPAVNEFLEKISENKDKVEAILIKMKNKFLGKSKTLYKIWSENSEQNSEQKLKEFSDLIRELYIKAEFNPFDIRKNSHFYKFLDFIKENEGICCNLECLKEEYLKKINGEKESIESIIKEINNDDINIDIEKLTDELIKKINKTSKSKYKTLKKEFSEEDSSRYDILIKHIKKSTDEELDYLSCSAIKGELRKFVFNMKLYNDADEECNNPTDNVFEYFDKINNGRITDDIINNTMKTDEKIKEIKKYYQIYCFNFKDRLKENEKLKEDFVELFIKILKNEIEEDRKECIDNIINTDIDIRTSLELTLLNIEKLFSFNNTKLDENLKKILHCCVELSSNSYRSGNNN